ncbi:MAG: adenine-specific methyltransferase EcoRI family protein, partial [Desulfovibrionaceae bacterium]|nr:adenine-specific methyltransferase EcoRI family protein [Desulfovibrionaceae bacterium]
MANRNSNLIAAMKAKKDEFYTQLADIEKELRHYRQHFQGKTVLCNCDDPFESNFFKYFV